VIDTKENILQTALRLFAQDGYEAVSVSEIAVELGMTKGALYKHYKNKKDIFDCIVERVYATDSERSKSYKVPDRIIDEAPQLYSNVDIKNIKAFTEAQFRFWMDDDFSVNIRKMLSLERYRNSEMADLYQKMFVGGPVDYFKDVFAEMMKEGVLEKSDSKLMAIQFCAPFYLLLNLSDVTANKKEMADLFKEHLENFMSEHFARGQSKRKKKSSNDTNGHE
jgi:AcrR family transcriptional regulator